MKKIVVFLISALTVLTACEKETIAPRPIDLVLEDLSNNQDILDQAFLKGGVNVAAGDVNGALEQSKSKREFILMMKELTHELLIKAIQETEPSMAGYLKIGDIKGESTETSTRLLDILTSGGEEPMPDYYSMLSAETKNISPAVWVLLKNYSDPTGKELPLEEMTLNYEQVSAAIKFSDLLVSSVSDAQQAADVEELAIKENIPPVMIGLLLPAVQKMKEEATDPLEQWLDSAVGEAINGGLNRDIIRRIKAAGFLANMDQLINKRYDNSNQKSASTDMLLAEFEAIMMFTWAEVWEQTK